jgi:hypothetical protein
MIESKAPEGRHTRLSTCPVLPRLRFVPHIEFVKLKAGLTASGLFLISPRQFNERCQAWTDWTSRMRYLDLTDLHANFKL